MAQKGWETLVSGSVPYVCFVIQYHAKLLKCQRAALILLQVRERFFFWEAEKKVKKKVWGKKKRRRWPSWRRRRGGINLITSSNIHLANVSRWETQAQKWWSSLAAETHTHTKQHRMQNDSNPCKDRLERERGVDVHHLCLWCVQRKRFKEPKWISFSHFILILWCMAKCLNVFI